MSSLNWYTDPKPKRVKKDLAGVTGYFRTLTYRKTDLTWKQLLLPYSWRASLFNKGR